MDRARQMEGELTMARSKKKEYAAQRLRPDITGWYGKKKKILTGKLQELLAEKERRLQSEQIAEKNLQQWETVATQEETPTRSGRTNRKDTAGSPGSALGFSGLSREEQLKLRSQEQRLSLEQLERWQSEKKAGRNRHWLLREGKRNRSCKPGSWL